ncbi:MAG TPA: 4-(cytidine 5'-diphospho)-2-C-methyl-D-erythritol kinase [Firmicutes bacterium]|jgi:4-diphosphocytidyl-2-C-methyl-D-erythritol kinase|nr:4-(cytidine 5'-diphospho)-2-C-methyl-D-erythritol kinase [Bacillota bacterium]
MTTALTISAPAKLNLGLTVLRRRNDGYHEISSVMQQISLADKICLEPRRKRGFSFFCTDPALSGEENLVYRAAALLSREVRRELPGVAITLYKQIPAGAGLGGGSSDAAAALRGLNSFWGLGLEPAELAERGALLGSDVPYCLLGGTALATGRGEKLAPLPPLPFHWVALALPAAAFLSTKEIYGRLSPAHYGRPPLEPLIEAVRKGERGLLREWFSRGETNTLERAVLPFCRELGGLKEKFSSLGLAPALTGSGPACFALTGDIRRARRAARALQEAGHRAYLCWTLPRRSRS